MGGLPKRHSGSKLPLKPKQTSGTGSGNWGGVAITARERQKEVNDPPLPPPPSGAQRQAELSTLQTPHPSPLWSSASPPSLVLLAIKHFHHFPSRISLTSVALVQGFSSDREFNLPSLPGVEKMVFSKTQPY